MTETEHINALLDKLILPETNLMLKDIKVVKDIFCNKDKVVINILLPFPAMDHYKQELIKQIIAEIAPDYNGRKIDVSIDWKVEAHKIEQNIKGVESVKNIIAVASGKGGVGKSTTAANLALAIAKQGARVGILDADIYGPNQPNIMGLSREHPESTSEKKIKPLNSYDIQVMSIGFLIEQNDTPMIWRGPMVSTALQQLLYQTVWDNLDYLIIDLPPGTGDIQLTLAQKIPVTAAVIITTPQDIALLDVRKAIRMFEKVRIPVLGIIENMSTYLCPKCQHEEAIFGEGGADKIAKQYEVEVLGHLPLALKIRADADAGKPTVVAEPESSIALEYQDIALKILIQLALLKKSTPNKFPKIVVENK